MLYKMVHQPLTDSVVEWSKYSIDDIVCNKFSPQNWNLILRDVGSDRGLANFLKDNLIECYILRECKGNDTVGFIFLLPECSSKKIVSIHGGGWKHNPYLYYRGYILMIEHLLYHGIKVRTYCDVVNERAIRFNRSIGFVRYKQINHLVYLWINLKRLQNREIYKRFYQ
mgnify:CR=1 FL=1